MIRVGVLTPHAAVGADTEFPYMAAARVHTQVSRIVSPDAGGDPTPPSTPIELSALTVPAVLDEAAARIDPRSLDVLAYASTSSAYAIGQDAERDLADRLRQRWSIPVCSTAASAVDALRQFHVQRLALVHPPWFGDRLNQLGAAYFQSQGFVVVESVLAAVPNDPSRVEPGMVVDWVSENLSADVGAVFLGGNGFQAARAVHELEDRLGCLVLESNQVLLWAILAQTGVSLEIHGFGALLQ